MFFGSLPDAQYGDTSVVDISYGTTGAPVKVAQNLQSPTNSSTMIGTSTEFSTQLINEGTNLTLDVELKDEKATKIENLGEYFKITTENSTYEASIVVLATGLHKFDIECEGVNVKDNIFVPNQIISIWKIQTI